MTYSKTFGKEVQPQDFLIDFKYRLSKLELSCKYAELAEQKAREELVKAIAHHVVNHHTIKRGHDVNSHYTEYSVEVFMIPVDEFMGLVDDMARAILKQSGA